MTRFVVDKHLATTAEATLVSGGNGETDGNVQVVRRRNGEFVDGSLAEMPGEIGRATAADQAAGDRCERQVEERSSWWSPT